MQEAETQSPSAAPCPTEAKDPLAILERVTPYRIDDMHMLGRPERPTGFLMHLPGGFEVDLDSEGRILAIRWPADDVGFASGDFADNISRMPVPFLLFRHTSRRILLCDRAEFLVGNNGITYKTDKGDVAFIAAEELTALAYRPADSQSKPK